MMAYKVAFFFFLIASLLLKENLGNLKLLFSPFSVRLLSKRGSVVWVEVTDVAGVDRQPCQGLCWVPGGQGLGLVSCFYTLL